MTHTFRGVPIEFNPTMSGDDEQLVYAVPQSYIEDSNKRMQGWQFVEVLCIAGVSVYELQKGPDNET